MSSSSKSIGTQTVTKSRIASKKRRLLVCAAAFFQLSFPLGAVAQSVSNLDLTSETKSLTADISGEIKAGDTTQVVSTNDLLTPAQLVALYQSTSAGGQTLVLSGTGSAIGGTLTVSDTLNPTSSFTIPAGVTAVQTTSALNLTGNLTNSGTLYVVPNSATAVINASSIFNNYGALLSTMPALSTGLSPVNPVSLTLNATFDIINAGQIISANNLNLTAGGIIVNALPAGFTGTQPVMQALNNITMAAGTSGQLANIVNSGLINSIAGNINIVNQTLGSIIVNNIGGTLMAQNGALNVRDSNFAGKFDFSLTGGDVLAKVLNIWSGSGVVNIDVGQLTGPVNINAGAAHVNAVTSDLHLGTMNLIGDPTYFNQGNILIDSAISAIGNPVTIIASGNITGSGTGSIDTSNGPGSGGPILLIAGALFTINSNAVQPVPPGPGAGCPDCSQTSLSNGGGGNGDQPTIVTVTGASATGGNLDLSTFGAAGITANGTSGNASGGNITLVAFDSSTTPGTAGTVNAPLLFEAKGSGSGVAGNFIVLAGATSGTSITIGSIDVTNALAGSGGQVVMITATPTIPALSPLVIQNGFVNPTVFNFAATPVVPPPAPGILQILNTAGQLQQASITLGNITTNGSPITIIAGNDVNIGGLLKTSGSPLAGALGPGGNVSIFAGGDILTSTATAGIDLSGAAGNNGGNVLLVAGASFTPAFSQIFNSGGATDGHLSYSVSITGPSAGGGNIDLNTGGALTLLSTAAAPTIAPDGYSGGNVQLVALTGTTPGSPGQVILPSTLIITTGGSAAAGITRNATNTPAAGTSVTIDVADTSLYVANQTSISIQGLSGGLFVQESQLITTVTPNTSIVVATLTNTYDAAPTLFLPGLNPNTNGNVTILAGSPSGTAGTSINIGNIDTTGSNAGGGNITIQTGQAVSGLPFSYAVTNNVAITVPPTPYLTVTGTLSASTQEPASAIVGDLTAIGASVPFPNVIGSPISPTTISVLSGANLSIGSVRNDNAAMPDGNASGYPGAGTSSSTINLLASGIMTFANSAVISSDVFGAPTIISTQQPFALGINGGTISLQAESFAFGAAGATIRANGFTTGSVSGYQPTDGSGGSGGNITIISTGSTAAADVTLSAVNLTVSAQGSAIGGNGGTVSITSGSNISVDTLSLEFGPQDGANKLPFNTTAPGPTTLVSGGQGGNLNLTANGTLFVNGSLSADGSHSTLAAATGFPGGNGGTIVISVNSSTAFNIDPTATVNGIAGNLTASGAGAQGALQAALGNGGSISITNLGGNITVGTGLLQVTAAAATDTAFGDPSVNAIFPAGNGGSITLTGTEVFSSVPLDANGGASSVARSSGAGGSISITTDSSTPFIVGSTLTTNGITTSLFANGNVTGNAPTTAQPLVTTPTGNGGTITLTNNGSGGITIDAAGSLSVAAANANYILQSFGGAGGTISLNAPLGPVLSLSALDASGGAFTNITTTATNAPSAGSAIAINMSNTYGFQAGQLVTISGTSPAPASLPVNEMATIQSVADGVSITVAVLANSYIVGATVNLPQSTDNGVGGTITIVSNSPDEFMVGTLPVVPTNGVATSLTANGISGGNVSVTNLGTGGICIDGTLTVTASTPAFATNGGNGGTIFLNAPLGPVSVLAGLDVSGSLGNFSGFGGTITIVSNSPDAFLIGTVPVSCSNGVGTTLSANGGVGNAAQGAAGTISVTNLGTGGITVGTGTISVVAQSANANGPAGDGGAISLQAPQGPLTITGSLSANGGAGFANTNQNQPYSAPGFAGSISLLSNSLTPVAIGGTSPLTSLSANGWNGGTITVINNGGGITVGSPGSITVTPANANTSVNTQNRNFGGPGGSITLQAAPTASVTLTGGAPSVAGGTAMTTPAQSGTAAGSNISLTDTSQYAVDLPVLITGSGTPETLFISAINPGVFIQFASAPVQQGVVSVSASLPGGAVGLLTIIPALSTPAPAPPVLVLTPPPTVAAGPLSFVLPPALNLFGLSFLGGTGTIAPTDQTPESQPENAGQLQTPSTAPVYATASNRNNQPLLGNLTYLGRTFDLATEEEATLENNLPPGNIFIFADKDMQLHATLADISILNGSAVLVFQTDNEIAILNLHDEQRSAVHITISGTTIEVPVGRQVVLTRNQDGSFADINPSVIGYRGVTKTSVGKTNVFMSEFSPLSALATVKPLLGIKTDKNRQDRLLKTAAALYLLAQQRSKGAFTASR